MNICKICRHPKIKEINMKLIQGAVIRQLAMEMGLPEAPLYNHYHKHLPKALVNIFEKKEEKYNGELVQKVEEIAKAKISDNFDLQERFQFLVNETLEIFQIAKKGGRSLIALKSLDSLRNTYGLLINVLDKLEASKQLDLEIAKAKSGDLNEEAKLKYEKDIQILSFEELKMLQRLTEKINSQTDEQLILDGKVMAWDAPLKF